MKNIFIYIFHLKFFFHFNHSVGNAYNSRKWINLQLIMFVVQRFKIVWMYKKSFHCLPLGIWAGHVLPHNFLLATYWRSIWSASHTQKPIMPKFNFCWIDWKIVYLRSSVCVFKHYRIISFPKFVFTDHHPMITCIAFTIVSVRWYLLLSTQRWSNMMRVQIFFGRRMFQTNCISTFNLFTKGCNLQITSGNKLWYFADYVFDGRCKKNNF